MFSSCIEVVNYYQAPKIFYNPYIKNEYPLKEHECFTRYLPNKNKDEYDIFLAKNFIELIS